MTKYYSRLLYITLFITIISCFILPKVLPIEENFVPQPPFWHFLISLDFSGLSKYIEQEDPSWPTLLGFGSYHGKNLLYIITRSASITLYISILSMIISIVLGLFLIYFHFRFLFIKKIIIFTSYFPRLFFLILISAYLKLYEPSVLKFSVTTYLVWTLGITGAIFLLAQTSAEICSLQQALFVNFAQSLNLSSGRIFFRHILKNCCSLPISIAKQLRDNVLFVSILTFVGLVHLQPEDLGALIWQYSSSPDAFYQGWWILFFPCAFLFWLILLFDLLGHHLAKIMQKHSLVKKI